MLLAGVAIFTALIGPATKDQAAAEAARFCASVARFNPNFAATPKAVAVEERPAMPGVWLVTLQAGYVMVSKTDGRITAAVFRKAASSADDKKRVADSQWSSLISRYARAANYGATLTIRTKRELPGPDRLMQIDAVPCWGALRGSYRHAAVFQFTPSGGLKVMTLRPVPKPPKIVKPGLGSAEADLRMAAALMEAYELPAVQIVRPAEISVWKTDSTFEKDWRDQACKDRSQRNEGTLVYNSAYVPYNPGVRPEHSEAVYEAFLDANSGRPLVASRFGNDSPARAFDWRLLPRGCRAVVVGDRYFAVAGGAIEPVPSVPPPVESSGETPVFLAFNDIRVRAKLRRKDGMLAVRTSEGWIFARPNSVLRSTLSGVRGRSRSQSPTSRRPK